jgi:hypothetical protein
MSRVLVPEEGRWYHELNAVGYFGESELERAIRQHVGSLFPDFYVFPFKIDVTSKAADDTRRPDLAMVRRDYESWYVVEVELSTKALDHVLGQTLVFADGNYNAQAVAKYIERQIRTHYSEIVSFDDLVALIDDKVPQVLVIVDEWVEEWREKLEDSGIGLCVFQIHKSTHGHYVYRTVGKYPVVSSGEAHCRRDRQIANLFEVIDPFAFSNLGDEGQIDILFDGRLSRWKVIEDDGKTYLRFLGKANPLSPNDTYVLSVDTVGGYHFKVN